MFRPSKSVDNTFSPFVESSAARVAKEGADGFRFIDMEGCTRDEAPEDKMELFFGSESGVGFK